MGPAEIIQGGPFPGSGTAAVPAGELAAFGFAMERAQETIAMLGENLLRQEARARRAEERAEKAEAALAKIRNLAGSWTADGDPGYLSVQRAIQAECGRELLAIIGPEEVPGDA